MVERYCAAYGLMCGAAAILLGAPLCSMTATDCALFQSQSSGSQAVASVYFCAARLKGFKDLCCRADQPLATVYKLDHANHVRGSACVPDPVPGGRRSRSSDSRMPVNTIGSQH